MRELLEDGRDRTFVRLLAEAYRAGGTVLEGGAYLGFVTVHAALAAGPAAACSRSSRTHRARVLRENLAANGVDARVSVVPKALGEAAGNTRFYISGGGEMSSLLESAVA